MLPVNLTGESTDPEELLLSTDNFSSESMITNCKCLSRVDEMKTVNLECR